MGAKQFLSVRKSAISNWHSALSSPPEQAPRGLDGSQTTKPTASLAGPGSTQRGNRRFAHHDNLGGPIFHPPSQKSGLSGPRFGAGLAGIPGSIPGSASPYHNNFEARRSRWRVLFPGHDHQAIYTRAERSNWC